MTEEKTRDRDRPFNPWVIPVTDQGRAFISAGIAAYCDHEERSGKRMRARKESDQRRHEAMLTAILSDVACHALAPDVPAIAVSRCKEDLSERASRYIPIMLGKTFPTVLDNLTSPGLSLLAQTKGSRIGRRQTTISAAEGLLGLIAEHSVTLDDFGISPAKETINLKSPKKPRPALAGEGTSTTEEGMSDEDLAYAASNAHSPPPGSLIDYDDTDDTVRRRDQMTVINDHLAKAAITFDTAATGITVANGPAGRHLRRIFNEGSFDCGGRMFGGFWIDLSKEQRFAGLQINGEPIVEADYGQMAPRTVYALAGVPVPMQDIYAVPGLEPYRTGIKKIMGAMLFSRRPLQRFPTDTKHFFPEGWTVKDVTKAISDYHPSISHLFHNGIGYHTQFIESEIMVGVLINLIEAGVTALPIHDAMLVQERHSALAKDAMLSAFRETLGYDGVVSFH